MSRPLRIQFPNAIYHVMARGNGRQRVFHAAADYERMLHGLAKTVERTRWEVFAFVWMPNHIHIFLRTPLPNLSQGMQYLLGGYASWYAKRHQHCGHVFQGRFRGELIEDQSYFWAVSRYVHLNPVRGDRPVANHPEAWPWSSYPGYAHERKRLDYIAYDSVLRAWQGEQGGSDARRAYRCFVEGGVAAPPASPFAEAHDGWMLGGSGFGDRVQELLSKPAESGQLPPMKTLDTPQPAAVIQLVASKFGVSPACYRLPRSHAEGRDVAACLAHRRTAATLRQLAELFGLSHPDSVSNLIRRGERQLAASPSLLSELGAASKFAVFEKAENSENRV